MVDTVRTVADLLTNLFQDGQGPGDITPQDMRDLIVSFQMPYAEQYVTTPAATVIGVAGTYVKAEGTTSPGDYSADMDAATASFRIQYTGAIPRVFQAHCSLSLNVSGSNQDLGLQLYRYDFSGAGGALLPGTLMRASQSGTNAEHVHTGSLVVLDTNDYIEAWITNYSSTNNPTIENGRLSLHGI